MKLVLVISILIALSSNLSAKEAPKLKSKLLEAIQPGATEPRMLGQSVIQAEEGKRQVHVHPYACAEENREKSYSDKRLCVEYEYVAKKNNVFLGFGITALDVDNGRVGGGVNYNSGLGVGSERTGAKFFGNGLYVGTKGIDVSAFGLNLRLKFW